MEVAGVVLAAGAGVRLRPLTRHRPKPLCPVAGVPLLDLAIARVRGVAADVAVNVHHGRDAMERHLTGADPGVLVSIEAERALGTAGALGRLRPWIADRPVVVVNGDTWCPVPLAPLLEGWDGERTRLFVVGRWPTPRPRLVAAVMPWADVAGLAPVPSGLWEVVWRAALDEGRLDVAPARGPFVDCGTPAAYLAANLAATEGRGFVDPAAAVGDGVALTASVVWDDGRVEAGEVLDHAVRYAGGRTLLVR